VNLPVFVDASGIAPTETNLGYTVELTEARLAVEDIVFTIAGEAHASLWRRVSDFLIPTAHAHPGHFQGGDVTGELRGRFLVDWMGRAGAELGLGTLLVGKYKSANFTFTLATTADGLSAGDALLGHTAVLRGNATKGNVTTQFTFVIDSPDGRELVGAPFEFEVRESSQERIGFRLLNRDPLEGDALFDDIDFAALDSDGDGALVVDPASTIPALIDAYNTLRRTFQTHDHFDARTTAP
jgi:hypothetical protein